MKNIKLKLLAFLICLSGMLCTQIQAQKVTFEDVLKVRLKNIGPIIKGNDVAGYYAFYEVDKINSKSRAYLLKVLDQNLNEVGSKEIIESKHLSLQEASFNGEAIIFKFYNPKKKEISFQQIDKDVELKEKKVVEVESKYEQRYYTMYKDEEIQGKRIFAVPEIGFVNYELIENKKLGYAIRFLSSKEGQKSWTYRSNGESKLIEGANFLDASSDIILSSVMKRPNMLSKDYISYLLAINAKTGRRIFIRKLEDTKYTLVPLNGYINQENNENVLVGLYYNKRDKEMKAKSLGLFLYRSDAKGTVISKDFISWGEHVSKFLPVNEKGKLADIGFIHFHKVVRTNEGKIFAIGESYKKVADGVGIALKVLNTRSNTATVQMAIEDLLIFEFAPDFTLNNVSIFDKHKSRVKLPSGAEFISPQLLATFVDALGGFDYSHTQIAKDQSSFSVAYMDYDRDIKNWAFGTITHADNTFSTDKIPLESDAHLLSIHPAKPGYIMIMEYHKKRRALDMRLEKINY